MFLSPFTLLSSKEEVDLGFICGKIPDKTGKGSLTEGEMDGPGYLFLQEGTSADRR